MNLKKKIELAKNTAIDSANNLVKVEALRVAKCWESILIDAATNGESERRFTEMTSHLPFENATDLTTRIYLEQIAEYFREQGLKVSEPTKKQNINGFQMEITVYIEGGE